MAGDTKLHSTTLFYILVYVDLVSFGVSTLPYQYFSTKTAYDWVHPASTPVKDELYNQKDGNRLTCKAIYASAVHRHGARNPSLKDINGITNLYNKIINTADANISSELQLWSNRFPNNDNKSLSSLGKTEQEGLGERTAMRLSTLFKGENTTSISCYVTSEERTTQSAIAFSEGFNRANNLGTVAGYHFNPEVNNTLLRFYDLCDKYVSSVLDNKTALKEPDDFESSEKVARIKEKIERKLNISQVLTAASPGIINDFCAYETGLNYSSPWCSLLDESDMKILEYQGDLENYYENGYGYQINWQQSCPLVSAIFTNLDKSIMDNGKAEKLSQLPVGRFHFAHAETLGPLFSALGLFNDSQPLTADNYDQQSQRLFRTSKILPFSANMLFVLYECVVNETGKVDYYIKLLVNEEPTLIPGCEELLCSYSFVREHYHDLIDQCNFKELCQLPEVNDGLYQFEMSGVLMSPMFLQHYENAYGNWHQSCPLVSANFTPMDKSIMGNGKAEQLGKLPVAQYHFAHAETIIPVMTALGLFNDSQPLTADNYDQQSLLFQTSKILPFFTNILFVAYGCVVDETGKVDYYIKFLVNVEPTC